MVSLDELRLRVGNTVEYTYDFGDEWIHRIAVKAREELSGEAAWTSLCICVDGARAARLPKTAGVRRGMGN